MTGLAGAVLEAGATKQPGEAEDQELAIKYCLGQLTFEAFEQDQICLYVCNSWGSSFVRVKESHQRRGK